MSVYPSQHGLFISALINHQMKKWQKHCSLALFAPQMPSFHDSITVLATVTLHRLIGSYEVVDSVNIPGKITNSYHEATSPQRFSNVHLFPVANDLHNAKWILHKPSELILTLAVIFCSCISYFSRRIQ